MKIMKIVFNYYRGNIFLREFVLDWCAKYTGSIKNSYIIDDYTYAVLLDDEHSYTIFSLTWDKFLDDYEISNQSMMRNFSISYED
jgi:hypothetical protein